MSLLGFVLAWVVVALIVFFIAISGGPRGAQKQLQTQSRRGRKLSFVFFGLAVLLLGVGVPGAVIAGVETRNDIPTAQVVNLTKTEKQGRELFGQRCKNCHSLKAANSVAQVGPNFDQLRPPKCLVIDAINKGRARGNGQMAAGLLEGSDADAVAQFIAKAVGQNPNTKCR